MAIENFTEMLIELRIRSFYSRRKWNWRLSRGIRTSSFRSSGWSPSTNSLLSRSCLRCDQERILGQLSKSIIVRYGLDWDKADRLIHAI